MQNRLADGGSARSLRSVDAITAAFLELERDLDLFEWTVDETPLWERLRFHVHKDVLTATGLLDEAKRRTEPVGKHERFRDVLDGFTRRNPWSYTDAEVVVFAHPRRKQRSDGYWWNVRFDPFLDRLDCSWLMLESPIGETHKRPARTDNLRYLDAIELVTSVRSRFSEPEPLTASERARAGQIRGRIRSQFGVDVDIHDRIRRVRSMRRHRLPAYISLLERIDPALVLLTVSYGYGKETQIEACKRLGVPVAELQHGVIDPSHLGYSFPGPSRNKVTFPDYLLVYGPFWRDAVEYPIPANRIYPVGHPFLEHELPTYPSHTHSKQVVFVSQGTIGHRLSKFAAKLAADPDFEPDIVYKLHPAETERYPDEYPWLESADLRISDGTETSLYELFAGSTAQVGVYSTALYEGLRFGLRTYLVDLPGVTKLDPLIEDGAATLVSSVEDLTAAEAERGGDTPAVSDRYFTADALDVIPATVDCLKRTGTTFQTEDNQR